MCHAPKCVIDATIDYISTTHNDAHDTLVHTLEVEVDQNQWCTGVQGAVSVSALDGGMVWTSLPFLANETTVTVD
jgi:hypothetical protein